MRIVLIYLFSFSTVILLFYFLVHGRVSPDNQILGEWKEVRWEYEKVDNNERVERYKHLSEYVESTMGQHLIIHQAETWKFMEDGKLKLSGQHMEEIVEWRIKGRGHILELRHQNKEVEYYDLTRLDDNTMVLNFDSDMQVRGIAKLTFEKINYAEKI